jgi:4-hydroxy-tetrahydrodipicolinate reductase
MKVVLVGAAGRMGRAIAQTMAGEPDSQLKACIDRADVPPPPEAGAPWGHDLGAVVARGDVVIEFSSPEAAVASAAICSEKGAALVSGTTGLGEADEQRVRAAARKSAIVRAANFSLGVLALRRALATVLGAVPSSWDVEIVERHHRGKKDAPSGTALQLAREAAERRGYPASSLRSGRVGRGGIRPEAEIGIHSLRGGSWVGDHAVVFAGPGEWMEIRHVAEDRAAFAHGVLAAARFVATAPPGFYTLDEVASAAAR